jgi:hypothetical protein
VLFKIIQDYRTCPPKKPPLLAEWRKGEMKQGCPGYKAALDTPLTGRVGVYEARQSWVGITERLRVTTAQA